MAIPLWIGYGRERCKAVPCQRMRYYPRQASLFWVDVVVSKGDVLIKTRKYRGEEPVMPGCRPSGAVPWATCPSSSVLSATRTLSWEPKATPGSGPTVWLKQSIRIAEKYFRVSICSFAFWVEPVIRSQRNVFDRCTLRID